ncbi:TPA: hypothetical protein HA234_05895 [Candidatus Woesearchaeota archaeon]|nr:hypothetical protein [Candidatus Woesearchaeota archaeon]
MKKTKIPNCQWVSTFIVFSRILGWLIMGWVIYGLILKLTGHSPTPLQIIVAIIGGMFTAGLTLFLAVFHLIYHLRKDVSVLQERTRNIERTLEVVATDLKQHIQDTSNRH